VSRKPRALSDYWGFHGKSVYEAWHFLEWIASASFEFEKARSVYGY